MPAMVSWRNFSGEHRVWTAAPALLVVAGLYAITGGLWFTAPYACKRYSATGRAERLMPSSNLQPGRPLMSRRSTLRSRKDVEKGVSNGADWRDYRARLVALEQTGTASAPEDRSDGNDDSKDAVKGWAYQTPLIEQGSVLLSHVDARFSDRQIYFHKAVILIVHHQPDCDMGIILNRPSAMTTANPLRVPGTQWNICFGGDCNGLRRDTALNELALFCLHTEPRFAEESMEVVTGIYLMEFALARKLVKHNHARRDEFLVLVGYCGWGKGQLQAELDTGRSWTMAAVDRLSLMKQIRETQTRFEVESMTGQVDKDDGMEAWRRMYDALGKKFQDQAGAWRLDVMLDDMRLRSWVNDKLY